MAPVAPPPYPCTGSEPVIDHIELLDAEGNRINMICGSACFADWYAPQVGCTWRPYLPPDLTEDDPPVDEPEEPVA